MKMSDIYIPQDIEQKKIRLSYGDMSAGFKAGDRISIERSEDRRTFYVSQYEKGAAGSGYVQCTADQAASEYLWELFAEEHDYEDAPKYIFLIDGTESKGIVVQPYVFRKINEKKTPITINVSGKILERYPEDQLYRYYVCDQLGYPALILSLNDKNKQNPKSDIRIIGGRSCMLAHAEAEGRMIIADRIVPNGRNKYYLLPIILAAPEIRFVPASEHAYNEELSADLEKISNPESYFSRWEAYNELSRKLLENESDEFGEVSYTSFEFMTEANGISFEFTVDEEPDDSFTGREIGASRKRTADEEPDNKLTVEKQFDAGEIREIEGNKIRTFLEGEDNAGEIPASGVLKLYTEGDRYIMKRRESARDRMIKFDSPIKYIKKLIEEGFSEGGRGEYKKPVTEEFKRNFKRAAQLNPQQIKALELAINTPDIALIQGPPGTGKTTVIKAIAERFREIFEAAQKDYQKIDPDYILHNPRILISSFQNEAVDNAISDPLPGDIPPYRKTAKRAKETSQKQNRRANEDWYMAVSRSISETIEDETVSRFAAEKRRLNDEFLSYKNDGEPIEKAAVLINKYLSYVDIPYPPEITARARTVIAASGGTHDDVDHPVIKRIEALRTSKDAFEDDGMRNAGRLAACIRLSNDLEISDDIREAVEAVSHEGYSQEEFDEYLKAAGVLRERFCKGRSPINPGDRKAVSECILELADAFSKHYLDTLSSLESKKSLIKSDFLERLGQEYEDVIRKYSVTTAATCQTCLDPGMNKTYDLVIIDEAARANPLDLFIPMSMGRKIILVGDHKQLPHMLEPDVLKLLTEDPKFKDIPEIEKSLFERLFGMFSKGREPKAIALTEQFRMHPDICSFVSEVFYDGKLKTADSITPQMRASSPEINGGKPLTFVNIPISRGRESTGISKSRRAEAEIISKDARRILDADPGACIGIITFYSAQSELIRQHIGRLLNDEESDRIEIGTVDAFQGKEFDYVLLSCVRSNPSKDGKPPVVGFLEKPNRLCVAFSRAIRQLAVYGDADTLKQIPCFSRLYDICKAEGGGCYREY